MLQFQPDNNSYNIQLYSAVCKACGVDTSDEDKIFEDYQAIYEKILAMEQEQVMGRRMEAGHDRCALSFCYRIWLKTGLHHDKNLV